jgi:pimeloyl-ACP methyl ester carboxylesterase
VRAPAREPSPQAWKAATKQCTVRRFAGGATGEKLDMAVFERRTLDINGVDTVVLTAGSGPTLVFFHGAGTVTRVDFAAPWTRDYEVIVPYHPGFGESADDPQITEIHDYVLHYLELFAALGLTRVRLVGQSMGGYIAAKLAVEHGYLVEKLVLVCPIGIPIPGIPTTDFLKLPPEQLPALLAVDPQTVIKHLPATASDAFVAERVKETVTATRLIGAATYDAKLPRYLHRVTMPTLLVWGTHDRLTPSAQHATWKKLLPRAKVELFDGGHLVLDESAAAVAAIQAFLRK